MRLVSGGDSSNPVSGDMRVSHDRTEIFDGNTWVQIGSYVTTGAIVKKYIVAGNYAEYQAWLKEKGFTPQEYVYVDNVNTLRGTANPHGFYVGSWERRKDINDISTEIRLRQMT